MKKFKVGDRVRAIRKCDGVNLIGYEGTVRIIDDAGSYPIGVEFDMPFRVGHNLNGKGKSEHCRWCEESSLELIKGETIVIYSKGNEVVALDKRTGKKAVAKCSPDDTFDFNVGAKLAFERLTKNVTFKLLCVEKFGIIAEKGKVYEFIDGYTQWKTGKESSYYKDFDDFRKWNKECDKYFVELKDCDDPAEILKKYDREIRVGDRVKVINTGRTYTTNVAYFEENNVPVELACKYAYGDSLGYSKGRYTLNDIFNVRFIADDRCVIQRADAKCYLIDCDGVKKC